jgi:hypothetical protein
MTTSVVPALSRDPYRVISRLGAVADAFYFPRTPVVMGPGLRRDDVREFA